MKKLIFIAGLLLIPGFLFAGVKVDSGGAAVNSAVSGATAGSVFFAGTNGVMQQDNGNFFWSDSSDYLCLGANDCGDMSSFGVLNIIDATRPRIVMDPSGGFLDDPDMFMGISTADEFYAGAPAGIVYLRNNNSSSNTIDLYPNTGSHAATPTATRLRVTNTAASVVGGNLGVGTASPSSLFHVSAVSITVSGTGAAIVNAGYSVQQSSVVTISDSGGAGAATYTLTPIASNYRITCNDADGCNVTMGETGIVDGQEVRAVNMGSNTVNFADTSGVSEIAGAFAAGQYDVIGLSYQSDRWVQDYKSDN